MLFPHTPLLRTKTVNCLIFLSLLPANDKVRDAIGQRKMIRLLTVNSPDFGSTKEKILELVGQTLMSVSGVDFKSAHLPPSRTEVRATGSFYTPE
jgi:hypothetical protein